MNNRICTLCLKQSDEPEPPGHLCRQCADELEFGYRSFPAYPLEERDPHSAGRSE
ncbi:hypothetical protein [Paenibacillus alkalitolerans]|uniref:hypothetical protein n=1 Tax=Paenibacillus alkalitolerans TaxID=2799335 RepID=UPI0018F33607|nr:hypothetical protein [Paenibacillus alkalitolerans]